MEFGNSMKPDFNAMSRAELLAYLKEHRTDDQAWGIYLDRHNPNAKKHPAPLNDEGIRIMEEAFREKLGLSETPRLFPKQEQNDWRSYYHNSLGEWITLGG